MSNEVKVEGLLGKISRRDFMIGGVAVAATAVMIPVTQALAGMGAGSSTGGGGSGSYNGYPYCDWYDSLDGHEQGHTVASNYDFWVKRVRAELAAAGMSPVVGNPFELDGPSYTYADGHHGSLPKAKEAMRVAMTRAFERNGSVGTWESAHVRIVGVAFCGGIYEGGSTNYPLSMPNVDRDGFMKYVGMMDSSGKPIKPVLDNVAYGKAHIGYLLSSDGWSQATIDAMAQTIITDTQKTVENTMNVICFMTWAVSDWDLSFDLTVTKRSARPDVVSDVSGAEYTVYKDKACTQIAKGTDGANAVLKVGSSGTSNTVRVPRSSGFEGSGNGGTHYFVKETKGPSNGLFEMDDTVYEVTDQSHLHVTLQGTKINIESIEEVKTGFVSIDKDLQF